MLSPRPVVTRSPYRTYSHTNAVGASGACLACIRGSGTLVTQRSIEMVIGRLLTDEEFRGAFLTNPLRTLRDLLEGGTSLTPTEINALVSIDPAVWPVLAEHIDPRLQKICLKSLGARNAEP